MRLRNRRRTRTFVPGSEPAEARSREKAHRARAPGMSPMSDLPQRGQGEVSIDAQKEVDRGIDHLID